jgi:hypothetical protein
MNFSFGTVLSLTGTGITTSYQAGTKLYCGRPTKVRFSAKAVAAVGTSMTSFEVEVLGSDDDVSYYPVASLDATDEGFLPLDEHSYAISGAPVTVEASVEVPGNIKFLKVQAKATGGAGQAGESIIVNALAT